ncbi:MAG: hypothetical protein CM15mP73_4230 [Hyphomicrobiales bacterium]|nr:MAG: hypothetical protein CM15mP73_4230 [Hyphomicrobiales bacterium]
MAPPFKQVEFDIMYGEGISKAGELIDLGVKIGIVDKAGSWYAYGDERLGQGKKNARQFLKENSEIAEQIENQIRAASQKKDSSPDEHADIDEEKNVQISE